MILCAVYIQAKLKQRFIRVPVKRSTKCHTRCCMDLANLRMMQPARKYQASLRNQRRFRCYASRLISEVQRCQGKFGPRSKPCMMVGYAHDSNRLWRICNPHFQWLRAQTEVIFDEETNAHMWCQHGSNEIDMFGLPEVGEYVKEADTGDEPLQGQDIQPADAENAHSWRLCREDQTAQRSAAEAENAHSWCLRREDQTAQHSTAEAENAHSQCLYREDQTAQHSAVEAETITHSRWLHRENQNAQHLTAEEENAHSWRLCREDQTARHSAAVTKKSSDVPPTFSAPPIASHVTRSQGNAPTEALMVSTATGDPLTYAEAMESPQRDYWKRAMMEESTSILLNNLYLRSGGILVFLRVDNISMSYPVVAAKAAIEIKANLSEIQDHERRPGTSIARH